jgi:hypothetical protein
LQHQVKSVESYLTKRRFGFITALQHGTKGAAMADIQTYRQLGGCSRRRADG